MASDWTAVCGHCGEFDTVGWAPPPRVSLLAPDEIAGPQARIVEMPTTPSGAPSAPAAAASTAAAEPVETVTEPSRASG